MDKIGIWIFCLGFGVILVGKIWVLVVAFKQEVPWGVACLFIPFVSIVFLVKYWEKAARPFAVYAAGFLLMMFGAFLGPPAGVG